MAHLHITVYCRRCDQPPWLHECGGLALAIQDTWNHVYFKQMPGNIAQGLLYKQFHKLDRRITCQSPSGVHMRRSCGRFLSIIWLCFSITELYLPGLFVEYSKFSLICDLEIFSDKFEFHHIFGIFCYIFAMEPRCKCTTKYWLL